MRLRLPLLLVVVILVTSPEGLNYGRPHAASPEGLDYGRPAAPRGRVVAVGDVHGAADAFAAILQRAELIDRQQKWIGGNAILVQTGDVTDRGPGVRAALDLLMALEPQAAAAGGRVHALLGNHEIMNMLGETRDVTPEIFASFGGEPAYREAFGPAGRYGRWLRAKSPLVRVNDSLFMHAGINPDVTTASIDELNAEVRQLIARWDEGVRSLEEKQ
ncbi:MAG TPA: metallophosphoesterase, partial [Vicinamibacterales bacterium]|nr:metallophosphoesterase [Vicinamibacterales bacterium]